MSTVTRRGLLTLAPAGAVVLAGCGSQADPRADADDPQLLDAALLPPMLSHVSTRTKRSAAGFHSVTMNVG